MTTAVTTPLDATALAAARVASARDDPARRLELASGHFGCGLPRDGSWMGFARSELAFLRAEISRGVLGPPDGRPPGSPWWRAVNERLLHDAAEATLLVQGHDGEPSNPSVELWLAFADEPSSASWYRAHNASIVAAYLEHESLAARELLAERFVLNVALLRVLYAMRSRRRPGSPSDAWHRSGSCSVSRVEAPSACSSPSGGSFPSDTR